MKRVEFLELQLRVAKAKEGWIPTVPVSTLLLEEMLKYLLDVPYIALQPELELHEEFERMNSYSGEFVKGFVTGHNASLQEAKKNVELAGYGVMHWAKTRSPHDTTN